MKFIKKSTKLISPGSMRPHSLGEMVENILQFKYSEELGVKFSKKVHLGTGRMPIKAVMKRNELLRKASSLYYNNLHRSIETGELSEISKVGVISDRSTVSHFEKFGITDHKTKKNIVITAKTKYTFSQKIKLWSCADAVISLSGMTYHALMSGKLLNRREFAYDDSTFIKNQTGINFKFKVSGRDCIEIQECLVSDSSVKYRHVILFDGYDEIVRPSMELSGIESEKGRRKNIQRIFERTKLFEVGREYTEDSDTVIFYSILQTDLYEIDTPQKNFNVFLWNKVKNYRIPIMCVQDTELNDVVTKYACTIEDVKEASVVFRKLARLTKGFKDISLDIDKFLSYLLKRSSAFTPVETSNKYLLELGSDAKVTSIGSQDFLRCMIMSTIVKRVNVNRFRLEHYFLNLFRNSPFYNNGVFDSIVLKNFKNSKEEILLSDETTEETEEDFFETILPSDLDRLRLNQQDYDSPKNIEESASISTESLSFDVMDDSDMEWLLVGEDIEDFDDVEDMVVVDGSSMYDKDQDNILDQDSDVVQMFNRKPDTATAVHESTIVHSGYEACDNLLKCMTKKMKEIMPVSPPEEVYTEVENFIDGFTAFVTGITYRMDQIEAVVKEMSAEGWFDSKIPLSAFCYLQLASGYTKSGL